MLDGIKAGILQDDGVGSCLPGPDLDDGLRAEFVSRQQRHAIGSYYDFRCNWLAAEAAQAGGRVADREAMNRALGETMDYFVAAGWQADAVRDTIESYRRRQGACCTILYENHCGLVFYDHLGCVEEVEWHERPGRTAVIIGASDQINQLVEDAPGSLSVYGNVYSDLTWHEVEAVGVGRRQVRVEWVHSTADPD
jgi:hypothetical protein